MNRRHFLQRATAAAAALAIDPEQLLWTPGQRRYVFVSAPVPTVRLTLAEIVAVTYDKVLAERRASADQWADSVLLQCLERSEVIRYQGNRPLIWPVGE